MDGQQTQSIVKSRLLSVFSSLLFVVEGVVLEQELKLHNQKRSLFCKFLAIWISINCVARFNFSVKKKR